MKPLALLLALLLILCGCNAAPDESRSGGVSDISDVAVSESTVSENAVSAGESEPVTDFTLTDVSELGSLLSVMPRDGSAVLTVECDCFFEEGTTIPFPLSIRFEGSVSGSLTIETDSAMPVTVRTDGGCDDGAITVLAPRASLRWRGEGSPMARDVALYMNVNDYNGFAMSEFGYGGTGISVLESFDSCGLEWSVDGNVVGAFYDYGFDENDLKSASFTAVSDGTVTLSSGDGTVADLSVAPTLTVTDDEGGTRVYLIKAVRRLHSLPAVNITVSGGAEVVKRDTELEAIFTLTDGGKDVISCAPVTIKGRGHSTWKWEKKPYKIEFAEKTSLFGLSKAKDWVLLANYADKALLRNTLALELARELDFDYVPTQIPVDLFINGTYRGVYSVGEQVEVRTGRVESEYLVEIGGYKDGDKEGVDYFSVGYIRYARIVAPGDTERTAEQFRYVRDIFAAADSAVSEHGDYEKYIDIDSLIDWFLLTEISYNTDGAMRRSCFATVTADGKIRFGPPWDYDLAFGNFSKDNLSYNDWVTVGSPDGYVAETWMNVLIEDKAFMKRVGERWNAVKDTLYETALGVIDEYGAKIASSQEDNYRIYNTWSKRAGEQPLLMLRYATYEKQLQFLRDYLLKRFNWISKHLK